jgi:hypothetical protein
LATTAMMGLAFSLSLCSTSDAVIAATSAHSLWSQSWRFIPLFRAPTAVGRRSSES